MNCKTDEKLRVAVVGCGAISDIYLQNMIQKFDNLEVVACCAGHLEHALKKAQKFGIKGCTYEEILADASIHMVVILTPAPTHEELIQRALLAGKHVYTEKTMTLSTQSAQKLLQLAAHKGLYLGSAPDTFLGASLQTANRAIAGGLLGQVTSFEACANRDIDLLASLYSFLRMPGGGICYDFGVYYLTALVSLLGPVDSVVSSVHNRAVLRKNIVPDSPEYGQEFRYDNESQVFSILRMENGVTGTFVLNGDSIIEDQAIFTIYGKEGILKLPDPNQFGGKVIYLPRQTSFDQEKQPQELDYGFPYKDNSRGVGPSEMADAILNGRTSRVDAGMAFHVLDVIEQIMVSSKTGTFEKVPSTCSRPQAMY